MPTKQTRLINTAPNHVNQVIFPRQWLTLFAALLSEMTQNIAVLIAVWFSYSSNLPIGLNLCFGHDTTIYMKYLSRNVRGII